jgi:hypothetical protein
MLFVVAIVGERSDSAIGKTVSFLSTISFCDLEENVRSVLKDFETGSVETPPVFFSVFPFASKNSKSHS